MADTKLTALTELTAPAAGDFLYAVDVSDTTDDAAGSSRKLLASTLKTFYGGLTPNAQTITTGDVTGAVGQLYICTIAGLTADRNLTLPSASAGERVGVYVVDGDASYALILKGAASQTINGGSAATEWSRVFIQGECVIFTCTAANTWIVEYDGRIPQKATIYLSTNASAESASTWTVPTSKSGVFTALGTSVGVTVDTANSKLTVRRTAVYLCAIGGQNVTSIADQKVFQIAAGLNSSAGSAYFINPAGFASGPGTAIAVGSVVGTLNAGDYLQYIYWQNDSGSRGLLSGTTTAIKAFMSVSEIL